MTHPMLQFLNGCLDEDERVALIAAGKAPPPWWNSNGLVRHSGPSESGMERDDGLWDDEGTSGMKVDHRLCMWGEVADHVAQHDPAAVLALVAAFRAILDIHCPIEVTVLAGWSDDPHYETVHECKGCNDDGGHGIIDWPCPTVRALVSAYVQRSDYDPAWGPT